MSEPLQGEVILHAPDEPIQYPAGEGKTVSEALEDARILRIDPLPHRRFLVEECCDHYFRAVLTCEQMRRWIQELSDMVTTHDVAA